MKAAIRRRHVFEISNLKFEISNLKSVIALSAFCLLPSAFCPLPLAFAHDPSPELLETGSASKLRSVQSSPTEIKVVSYNIRWRGGTDLERLIAVLRDDAEIGQAEIIGLQEVDRNRKRTGNVNTARQIAEALGLNYAWAAPPSPADNQKHEEETGVAIMSPYPLTDITRIVLPNPGPGGRRRVALGATVQTGATRLRVYSVHAETRTTNERRLQQFQAVLDDLETNHAKTERAVVLGDFNTLTSKDVKATTSFFTKAGFATPFPNSETTWHWLFIELKNDWIWLRSLRPLQYGIDKKIGLSDHWPLWLKVSFDAAAPDIRGKLTQINRANNDKDGLLGTLLIEGSKEADAKGSTASVRVTRETLVYDRRGKAQRQVSFDDLRTGQKVEARFTGPVLQSSPVQATASEIVILN
jgi:endonuclease/exonuclease/phosphatase family metal-dependent hydrolase